VGDQMPQDEHVPPKESEAERLDRNLIELLNELRVTGTGIQVLLAFLLIVPFNSGYKHLTSFDKHVYFVALLCMASSTMFLIAPSVHHRLLFRHGQRPFIIAVANELAIIGMILLAFGLVAIMVLLSNVVFGTAAAVAVGGLAALLVGGLWFLIPLARRKEEE
jgi:Kef-type K+ transport system membrane component KefB